MCVRKSPPVESLYGASISSHTTVELLCATTSGKWDFPSQITIYRCDHPYATANKDSEFRSFYS